MANLPHRRCAVYTRKSSEEGLEQDFNSLNAQREACEAYIKSQAGQGWRLVKTAYDDGGFSGATMERPALQQLLPDIRSGSVDVVVVYKVDRLTRSLADFAKMVELFDAQGVSFVAVTQQFNATTSMGRLTLNVLLSFAQFEREVTGERIRDKIAASKRKGMWMGGIAPLGYEVRERRLVVNPAEAETVRYIFRRYLELRSVRLLRRDLDQRGVHSRAMVWKSGPRGGGSFSRGALYELLANPIYIGEIRHKGERHPGQHEAIVGRELWEKVQQLLGERSMRRGRQTTAVRSGALAGKLFDENGEPLYSCATAKGGRRYRYYVSRSLVRGDTAGVRDGWRLAASEMERSVLTGLCRTLKDHAAISELLHQAGAHMAEIEAFLKAAHAQSRALEEASGAMTGEAANLVTRVDLAKGGFNLSLNLAPLIPSGVKLASGARLQITRFIPLQMKRRGVEMRLVLPGEANRGRGADPALLRAVARGYRWFSELASGTATNTLEIAQREGVGDSYVRRLIPLALLAPAVIEAIRKGRHPAELSTEALTRRLDLPIDWREQERLLAHAL